MWAGWTVTVVAMSTHLANCQVVFPSDKQEKVLGFDQQGSVVIHTNRGVQTFDKSVLQTFRPANPFLPGVLQTSQKLVTGEKRQTLSLVKKQGGPVSVTIETKAQPFANLVSNQGKLGGVLVANQQIVGPPCHARNGIQGDCRLLIKCVRFFFEIEALRSSPCNLGGGVKGVCCPHILVLRPAPTIGATNSNSAFQAEDTCPSNIICPPPPPIVVIPNIRLANINSAATTALANIRARNRFSASLFRKGIFTRRGSRAFSSQRFKQTNRFSTEEGQKAATQIETSQQLVASFKLSPEQGTFALPKFSIEGSKIADTCPKLRRKCDKDAPYRAFDGSCNNLNQTSWGKSNIPLQRLLPPEYEDGVEKPRSTGLPSPRAISTATISTQYKENKKFTLMLMQWGQFVDHDITHTPTVRGEEESGILCCSDEGEILPKNDRNRECFPIEIPENDRLYGKFNQRCMEFVRSMPAPNCKFGPRQQVNQITAWLDASNVYGSDDAEARKLRLLAGGRLRVTRVQGRDLLPLNPGECSDEPRHRYCFSAGDLRCNEQLELTVLHTVWMREHNRLADKLAELNKNWSDEKLYQEARRLVIAEMQHITYNEWLPIILGMKYMQKWSMEPLEEGYSTNYKTDVNPSITNVFATAAYRFGHSLIAGVIESYNLFGSKVKSIPLTKSQFAPYDLYDNLTLETFVRGLTTQKTQELDARFSPELTENLFKQEKEDFGMDLVSLNIQRARDHGLPSYTTWRKTCGQSSVSGWKELATEFPAMVVPRLQALYSSVDDIDLFVGGLLEKPVEGGLLGPTFLCLVGDQFSRLKTGDRFWYENGNNQGFSPSQLAELRKVSLARVLCDNAEDLEVIQPLAFHTPDVNNRRVACDSPAIPSLDLGLWQESSR